MKLYNELYNNPKLYLISSTIFDFKMTTVILNFNNIFSYFLTISNV